MRVKKVNRYYCDFCKKAGLSKYHMGRHEQHCTMNPNRSCRMCNFAGGGSASMPEMLELLPDPALFPQTPDGDEYHALKAASEAAMPALREAAGECPACIMAALRQRGIDVPMIDSFNFKSECKELFDAHFHENHGPY